MKILAPFVVVCIALLAIVVWQLRRSSRDAMPATPSITKDVTQPPAPLVTRPAGDAHATDELETAEHGPERDPRAATSSAPATRVIVPGVADVRERRARERLAELREILATDPYNEAALEAALELSREFEWHEAACDLLERLVSLFPDDDDRRFELAVQLMQLERWLEAIAHLRGVVERDPENGPATYNLAIAHQSVGHLRDARDTWDRVIELMPGSPDAYAHRGEVLLDLESWDPAVTDFQTALRIEPESIDVALNLSLALSKLGRRAAARETLRPILERNPRHVLVLNRLAQIAWLSHESDPGANQTFADETIDYCRRSLAVVPDQPEIKALLDRASKERD